MSSSINRAKAAAHDDTVPRSAIVLCQYGAASGCLQELEENKTFLFNPVFPVAFHQLAVTGAPQSSGNERGTLGDPPAASRAVYLAQHFGAFLQNKAGITIEAGGGEHSCMPNP